MTTENNKGRSSWKSATPDTTTERKCIGNSADAQRARLLAALETGPLTTLEARRDLDIMMPAARVHELRHRFGKTIVTERVSRQTEAGNDHVMALYVLLPGAQIDLFDLQVGGSA
ncbi:helix-turn-helix domain-containing protein [Caballeronia telluris]|uniref:Winged helix-turn-helix domain-containing protein n=1 Tax=Caballeronia telluris TaxID=326475 RepID=A0A158KHC9_9BURK|nr:helix-turn-helix domain-containing protein [Caballeronia telluris]SAL80153.1 hypothetical protein AWB66_06190 [Caballeronia telluris]